MVVYRIFSERTPRVYVGITTGSLRKRWREHLCAARTGSERPLYRAMRKYGLEAFFIEPIDTASSLDELREKELLHIDRLGSHALASGYNLTDHGMRYGAPTKTRGTTHYKSKLTAEAVRYIRHPDNFEKTNTQLQADLQEKYGLLVSRDCLRDARRGDSWKHLDAEAPPVKRRQGTNRGPRSEAQVQAEKYLRIHQAAASEKSTASRWGKHNPRSKLSPDQVREIFSSPKPLSTLAKENSVSKKLVLLVKQAKIHRYITEGLQHA